MNTVNEYGISKDAMNKLYKLMGDVHNLLKKNGVEYWVEGGTILGAYRHKGIIPWDDDVDITVACTEENLKKLKTLENELKKLNYGIVSTFLDIKFMILMEL